MGEHSFLQTWLKEHPTSPASCWCCVSLQGLTAPGPAPAALGSGPTRLGGGAFTLQGIKSMLAFYFD